MFSSLGVLKVGSSSNHLSRRQITSWTLHDDVIIWDAHVIYSEKKSRHELDLIKKNKRSILSLWFRFPFHFL